MLVNRNTRTSSKKGRVMLCTFLYFPNFPFPSLQTSSLRLEFFFNKMQQKVLLQQLISMISRLKCYLSFLFLFPSPTLKTMYHKIGSILCVFLIILIFLIFLSSFRGFHFHLDLGTYCTVI